jgi:hypothetical protein
LRAARLRDQDKDKLQVQEPYYGNIVSALDEIFAKIM